MSEFHQRFVLAFFFDSDVQQVPVILLGEVSGLGRGMFRKASVS